MERSTGVGVEAGTLGTVPVVDGPCGLTDRCHVGDGGHDLVLGPVGQMVGPGVGARVPLRNLLRTVLLVEHRCHLLPSYPQPFILVQYPGVQAGH